MSLAIDGSARLHANGPHSNWQWLHNVMLFYIRRGMLDLPRVAPEDAARGFPSFQDATGLGIAGPNSAPVNANAVTKYAEFNKFAAFFAGTALGPSDGSVPSPASLEYDSTLGTANPLLLECNTTQAALANTGNVIPLPVDIAQELDAMDTFYREAKYADMANGFQNTFLPLMIKYFFTRGAKDVVRNDVDSIRFTTPTLGDYERAAALIARAASPSLARFADRMLPPSGEERASPDTVPIFALQRTAEAPPVGNLAPDVARRIFYAQNVTTPGETLSLGDLHSFIRAGTATDAVPFRLPGKKNTPPPTLSLNTAATAAAIQTAYDGANSALTAVGSVLPAYTRNVYAPYADLSYNPTDPSAADYVSVMSRPRPPVIIRRTLPYLRGRFGADMSDYLRTRPLVLPRNDIGGGAPGALQTGRLPFDVRLSDAALADTGIGRDLRSGGVRRQQALGGTPGDDTSPGQQEAMARLQLAVVSVLQSDAASGNDEPAGYFSPTSRTLFNALWRRGNGADMIDNFVAPSDERQTGAAGFHWFLQTQLPHNLAALPLLLDYLRFLYGTGEQRAKRLADFRTAIGLIEKQLLDMQRRHLVGAESAADSAAAMRETAQRLYVPTAQHAARAHISGRVYFTPFFQAALQAGMYAVRVELGVTNVTLDELTSMEDRILSYTFASYLATHETDVTLSHPNQYKKDIEYKRYPVKRQDALRRLADALDAYTRHARAPGGRRPSAGAGGSGGKTMTLHFI